MNDLNKKRPHSSKRIAATLCLSSLLALLAVGCGGSSAPSEATEQDNDDNLDSNVTQQDSGNESNNQAPISSALPPDPNFDSSAPAGGSMLAPSSLVEQEQCSNGWLRTDEETDTECAATFGGLCFEEDDDACECAGCVGDTCLILESYPTQIACETQPGLPLPSY